MWAGCGDASVCLPCLFMDLRSPADLEIRRNKWWLICIYKTISTFCHLLVLFFN